MMCNSYGRATDIETNGKEFVSMGPALYWRFKDEIHSRMSTSDLFQPRHPKISLITSAERSLVLESVLYIKTPILVPIV